MDDFFIAAALLFKDVFASLDFYPYEDYFYVVA